MDDLLSRFWLNLAGRVEGPLMFRFLLQPAMAVFYGVRDGLGDARHHRPPFGWALLSQPAHRRRRVREAAASIGRLVTLSVVMDLLYQWIVLRWVYTGELIFVALMLACIPYVLVRGTANRLAGFWWSHRSTGTMT